MGLFNSTVLDVVIGLVFVYLLLAIICTTINEWIAGITAVRAKTLAKAIQQLLDDQKSSDNTRSFLQAFYSHPLISSMMTPGKTPSEGHPSYLSSRTFATVVMDLATTGKAGAITMADLENGAKALPAGDVRTTLLALIQNASGSLARAQQNIEHYFDDTMGRVSGWYKRRTQVVIVLIAAVLAIATNADSLRIGRLLWINGTLRSQIVEKAKSRTEQASTAPAESKNQSQNSASQPTKDELSDLKSLLGWSDESHAGWQAWLERILGWMLSIVAISLGAPFWFDTLNKVMNLRNAGEKPLNSVKQANETAPAA